MVHSPRGRATAATGLLPPEGAFLMLVVVATSTGVSAAETVAAEREHLLDSDMLVLWQHLLASGRSWTQPMEASVWRRAG